MSKLLSIIGFRANFEQYDKTQDVKVWFEKLDDGESVKVWCENFRTGGMLKKLGIKEITRKQFSEMPEDPYDNMVFFKASVKIFGGETF